MKTLNLRNIFFGLTAILAVAFTLTSCQQDSIINPIEIQDTETTDLRTCPAPSAADDITLKESGNRIYVYAFDHDGINHEFRYKVQGGQWTSLGQTTKYHSAIRNILPCTTYIVQLRVQCDDGNWSGWSNNASITTSGCGGCPTPDASGIAFGEYATTLYLYPTPYQVVTHEFEVSFNGGPFVSLGVRNSHYSAITNKQCGTYEIRLKVQCDDGNWSDWATVTYVANNC